MASAMAWLDRCTRLDAAIVDIRLPEGERAGLLVAERVSHQWPDAAIVITTGYYAPQYKPDADRIGAALLPKPYSIAAARAALLGELP
jgi:DNA-binding NarL/FixJ family response regulator